MIGYFLIDVAPQYVPQVFFMVGGFLGAFVSWAVGKHVTKKYGEVSSAETRRAQLHWAVGFPLAVIGAFGLAIVIPELRGPAGSQVLVVMIGMVYYYWGVYADRNFLWLGPLLIVGGIVVRFIPVYPWTCLGAVIALGLVLPTFFTPSKPQTQN